VELSCVIAGVDSIETATTAGPLVIVGRLGAGLQGCGVDEI